MQTLTSVKEASLPKDIIDNLYLSTITKKKAQKALSRNNLAAAHANIVLATEDIERKAFKERLVECPRQMPCLTE